MIDTVLNHLWQSTAFAAAAALLTLALRNNRASTRYWVWFAASLKFLVPFALLVALGNEIRLPERVPGISAESYAVLSPVFEAAAPLAQPFDSEPVAPVNEDARDTPSSAPSPWPGAIPIALMIWATGFVSLVTLWIVRWHRISAIVRTATPVPWNAPVAVGSTPAFLEPSLVGIWVGSPGTELEFAL